ncbi:thiol-disulfide oxidoreductase DCC family protein [Streptomyces sp. NPDC090046]|uniref:thiol-disulfide oxidoreductase DCC family protein n=1 Tax=Streptomyces sp. NPDC090046 TaxID=3365928 RepID=UPI0037FCD5A9
MNHDPILLFDGDCGFCAAAVRLARTRVAPQVRFVPWQIADLDTLGVTEEQADHEILWITPETGIVQAGARAAAHVLMQGSAPWRLVGRLLCLAPISWAAHAVYRIVARNRHRLPGGTTACSLPAQQRTTAHSPDSAQL